MISLGDFCFSLNDQFFSYRIAVCKSRSEQAAFQLDDNDVHFVVDQHA